MELHDLLFVHQQSSLAKGIAIEDVAVLVRRDVHTDDEQLTVLNVDIRVLQIHVARANAFDLGAEKLDARFIPFVHEIIVISLFVLGNYFVARLFISQNGHLLFIFAAPLARLTIILLFLRFVKGFFVE